MLQGFFLFGINYWLVYLAEEHLKSGLVAVIFSSIVFLNIFNGAIFLRSPIRIRMLSGAIIGIVGISLVFSKQLLLFDFSRGNSIALVIAIIGAYAASLGNIISAHNQKINLPVVQTNALGMMYGAMMMLIISLVMRKPFTFEISLSYFISLIYLSLFGSIIAFTCYLTLIGRIGADKSAYVTLVFPVIALILSTLFEGYVWTLSALAGVILILIGNLIIIQRSAIKLG